MGFTPAQKDVALAAVLDKPLLLGLLTETGEELDYERQPVEFAGRNGVWLNTKQVRFPVYTQDAKPSVIGWLVFDLSGEEKARGSIDPMTMEKNHRAIFEPGSLVIRWGD